jgi:hypothetical protein
MNAPAWLKPGLAGVACGAVAATIAGFFWGGWVTGGTAEEMASARAGAEVVNTLVPFCVARSQEDPNLARVTAELQEAATYKRADILMKAGWATMPGAEGGNLALAKACALTLAEGS